MKLKFAHNGRDVEFDLNDLDLGDWEDLENEGVDVSALDIGTGRIATRVMRVVFRHVLPQFNADTPFNEPALVAMARSVKVLELLGDEDDDADPTVGAASVAPDDAPKPKRAKSKKATSG